MEAKLKKKDMDTYVYIDASNIRAACIKTCGFCIDFARLADYLKGKYEKLVSMRYYEGIASNDKDKKKVFEDLAKSGYEVCSLKRRTYVDKPVLKRFECKKCKSPNRVEVLPKTTRMKSNVDVYLASEMLKTAFSAKKPTHVVVFSCDGDYAEAIKIAVENPNVFVTVIATPPAPMLKNTLSIRLRTLRKEIPEQYQLTNISDIRDYIDSKKSGSEDTLLNVGKASPVS